MNLDIFERSFNMNGHIFVGNWITSKNMSDLKPINVFHKQLDTHEIEESKYVNQHILFRKKFRVDEIINSANIYITADDYYKLYINGKFVIQGPTASYPFAYNYNVANISDYIVEGENTIAVHTLYQGLINRVWVSGDNQHGLLLDLEVNGKIVVCSDESFVVKEHSAYRELGANAYRTQFMESYDSNSCDVGFEKCEFDDSMWEKATYRKYENYCLNPQSTKNLVYEIIAPVVKEQRKDKVFVDFGACYVGYLKVVCVGHKNDIVVVRCGQEVDKDGNVMYHMRCNCDYEEPWILSGHEDTLDWFDYKSFRYAELVIPNGCRILNIELVARHYPFELKAKLRKSYMANEKLKQIWNLCVRTLKYGVQDVIQDCMDREKGFYVGDGCYSAITHMILSDDDSMVRYLIDSARNSTKFNKSTVACLNCSFMQEIAEYPLMLISLMLWHYRITKNSEYLKLNYEFACNILDEYKKNYENDYHLENLDKWCVVEWPINFQNGYAVDIREGKVCEEPHNVINAYYIEAISNVNKMAKILNLEEYRDVAPLKDKYLELFYDAERHLFKDGIKSDHSSYISNVFAYSFNACPDEESRRVINNLIQENGISKVSLFTSFVLLVGKARNGDYDGIKDLLLDDGAWIRMLREGATATFEGWGKDTKWNTSLFHLTMSYAALFMIDIDLEELFE